jgi:vacuolar-type H+-ATPase subunit E/Vma4
MQAQAEETIAGTTSAAQAEAAQLIDEAEAEAREIRVRHRARVEPMLVAETASLQNKAKLGALRASANAREQLLVRAFEGAQDCLAQLRESNQYAAILRTLACEVVQGLGNDLVVYVDPRDVPLATSIFQELQAKVEVQGQALPLGGLIAGTRDGRIKIVNTLAARLERSRNVLRGPVAAILAGKSESEKEWTTSTAMPMPA